MKNKKDDCAAELVSSDKEVNCVGATSCVSTLCVSRSTELMVVRLRAAELHSLQIGLVRAQQAKPMTARRKMGIIRVVHRLAALWLLASGLGNSLGEAAMVAPRRATVEVDRRCRRASKLPICGWSGDKDNNNRTSDVWRAPRQILRVRALPCIGDHCLAERLKVGPEMVDRLFVGPPVVQYCTSVLFLRRS